MEKKPYIARKPHASMQLSNSARRFLKLAHQPVGAWRKQRAYLANQGFGVAAAQDVQEKMTDGAIEWAVGQRMRHRVDLMKLHARPIARCHALSVPIGSSGRWIQ